MKRIVGFENYILTRNGVVYRNKKRLKPDTNSNGYLRVSLSKDGIVTRRFIHQLVAEHYVENPENLPVVNHKNGNRQFNFSGNLEWVTHRQNVNDGWSRGRRNSNRFSPAFEKEVYELATSGSLFLKQVAEHFGIHRDTVTQIVKRLRGRSNDYRKAKAKPLN